MKLKLLYLIFLPSILQAWETNPPPSPAEAKKMSTVVFIGAPDSFEKGKETTDYIHGLGCPIESITRFSVRKIWKGPKSNSFKVSGCYSFQKDIEYLVYAQGPEKELRIQPLPKNQQNRTTSSMSQAAEDILALGEPLYKENAF